MREVKVKLFFYDEIGRPLKVMVAWIPGNWVLEDLSDWDWRKILEKAVRLHPEIKFFENVALEVLSVAA